MGEIFGIDGSKKGKTCSRSFATRRDPKIEIGPLQEGILLEAAKSIIDERDLRDADWTHPHNLRIIQDILNPYTVTFPDAPYEQRICVTWRMLRMVEKEWGNGIPEFDGWLYDPNDGFIRKYESTPNVKVSYRAGDGWEYHFNTTMPENTLALSGTRDICQIGILDKHKKGEDIFGDNGLDLLVWGYRNIKFPLIGIRKVILFNYDKKETYTKGKFEEEEMEKIQRPGHKKFLKLNDSYEIIGENHI